MRKYLRMGAMVHFVDVDVDVDVEGRSLDAAKTAASSFRLSQSSNFTNMRSIYPSTFHLHLDLLYLGVRCSEEIERAYGQSYSDTDCFWVKSHDSR